MSPTVPLPLNNPFSTESESEPQKKANLLGHVLPTPIYEFLAAGDHGRRWRKADGATEDTSVDREGSLITVTP